MRRSRKSFLLRYAAEHADDFALAAFALELLETMENLLLGFVATLQVL
jgi:hypothetical protein